ncbi:protein DpdF [Archangium lansingense]|uniref:DNA 3'-5' helicase n=1 Tax=Archangium lansingense TaxID=2995310 RepID=A0ABT4ABS6_9BACT|nr:protein DpdF [Archangium lansinium]MCY1079133.1 protein DpdF [Archangium lansinium]
MEPLDVLRLAFQEGRAPREVPERPRKTSSPEYAAWRLLSAWKEAGELGADHAVLLRQLARWSPGVVVGTLPEQLRPWASRAGVRVTAAGQLEAEPFVPTWLSDDVLPPEGVDRSPEERNPREAVDAEPFLGAFGYEQWQSLAQKEAAWCALTAPPRSTTLIALPTGAGKSLCFQVLPRFGAGLTVVVVPTVALALDQWRQAVARFERQPDVNPLCYSADEHAEQVLAQARARATRLIFTSPEACVSGRLRAVLDAAVREGWLDNLVIDEAHIIETWGIYFRVDFQLLSMLWLGWMSRPECQVRTFLLSATFTQSGAGLLKQLFCQSESDWRESVSQRLRPEMTYFTKYFPDEPSREQAVLESLWKLPRPTILYTTEKADAEDWGQRLRAEGFQRIGVFHGDTPAARRRELLEAWRENRLDVMVATSAFGMGVDKPDVRAVVHACLPENLHRYYQEVGRGGRDGLSSVCLLLTTRRDRLVAEGLTPKLLRPENIQERWEGLWSTHQPVSEDEYRYKLRLNARPHRLMGERTYAEHIRWNKRLVLQLSRAKLLELRDLHWEEETEPLPGQEDARAEWLEVRLKFPPASPQVGELVAESRKAELNELYEGLNQMDEVLAGKDCMRILLRRVYGRDKTQGTCGGCRACRREPSGFFCPKLRVIPHHNPSAPSVVVTGAPAPATEGSRWVRAFREWYRRGLRRFACSPEEQAHLLSLCARADEHGRFLYRLDVLDAEPEFDVKPDEALVVLHGSGLLRSAFDLRMGARVIHLVGTSVPVILDTHGRWPLESQGVSLLNYEAWNHVH